MPVELALLENKHCRYVLDQKDKYGLSMYCGDPKRDHSSYCTCHHKKVWEKPLPYQQYKERRAHA